VVDEEKLRHSLIETKPSRLNIRQGRTTPHLYENVNLFYGLRATIANSSACGSKGSPATFR
jgi:hypothetical protein